jgi:hypothetical protein
MGSVKRRRAVRSDGYTRGMETITFKCPKDHVYTVPASFAGKKTVCKVCGAAFVIQPIQPPLEEPPPAEPLPVEEVPEAVPMPVEDVNAGFLAAAPPFQGLPGFPAGPAAAPVGVPYSSPPPFAPAAFPQPFEPAAVPEPEPVAEGASSLDFDQIQNGTARLVARLWAERGHGGIVELHLVGGSPILPEFYDPYLSDGTHGLFANHLPDGTITLTAVRWDAVQKVIVRKVEGLPDGMFEAFET